MRRFRSRRHAGQILATKLGAYGGDYDNFRPTSDEEVCRLLAIAAGDQAAVSA